MGNEGGVEGSKKASLKKWFTLNEKSVIIHLSLLFFNPQERSGCSFPGNKCELEFFKRHKNKNWQALEAFQNQKLIVLYNDLHAKFSQFLKTK